MWRPLRVDLASMDVIWVITAVNVLQEHTKVGSADSQDIQLCGMGIQAEHCVVNITPEGAVFLNPYRNSR